MEHIKLLSGNDHVSNRNGMKKELSKTENPTGTGGEGKEELIEEKTKNPNPLAMRKTRLESVKKDLESLRGIVKKNHEPIEFSKPRIYGIDDDDHHRSKALPVGDNGDDSEENVNDEEPIFP
jgi:hypothetical protein